MSANSDFLKDIDVEKALGEVSPEAGGPTKVVAHVVEQEVAREGVTSLGQVEMVGGTIEPLTDELIEDGGRGEEGIEDVGGRR